MRHSVPNPLLYSIVLGLLGGVGILFTTRFWTAGPAAMVPVAVVAIIAGAYVRWFDVPHYRHRLALIAAPLALAVLGEHATYLSLNGKWSLGLASHARSFGMAIALVAVLAAAGAVLATTRPTTV